MSQTLQLQKLFENLYINNLFLLSMAGVKITYETLFDLLRREKSRNELQNLDESFFSDVLDYLKEKNNTLTNTNRSSPLYSVAEHEKIKIQLKNVHKIILELYEIRQKKIINLAIHKTKTNSNLIDLSSMLPEERALFEDVCTLLNKYKSGIVNNILRFEMPSIEVKEHYKKPIQNIESKEEPEQRIPVKEIKKADESSSSSRKITFTTNLPKFVGLDKQIYGPFKEAESAEVPKELAEMLIRKGRAKEAKS